MEAFEIDEVLAGVSQSGPTMETILSEHSMRVCVAFWPAGAADTQNVHDEDEVYCVVAGRAKLRANGQDRDVQTGTTIFMPSGADHHFHSIDEDLKVLVVWGGGG